jgi:hypothetical protein
MRYAIFFLGALTAICLGLAALAADPAPGVSAPPAYRPTASDLMTAFIQPRHAKLFLAGQAGNWDLAEYERHNLSGAFSRMAVAVPKIDSATTQDLVAAFAAPPLADLQAAIKAKDGKAFEQAFDSLTAGCNGCHQTTRHGLVVLQRPAASAFPDQAFGATAR